MSPRSVHVLPAYGWCAVLSAANDDDLGTALAESFARHRPRAPELLEVTHYRHALPEAVGTAWFLFVAVVTGADLEVDLADSHPALARDLWHACERWTHSFPKFRVGCGRDATLLCDGQVPKASGGSLTCSAPICPACALSLGAGVDWCPSCVNRPTRLVVHTARIGAYRGDDAFDVTAKGGRGDGLAFAPAWSILSPVLDARRRARALREALDLEANPAAAGALGQELEAAERAVEAAWPVYVEAFTAQMRESHGPSKRLRSGPWRRLLARPVVTLLCFCVDPERCHRTLLARDILPRCGATYGGERPAAAAAREAEQLFWSALS